MDIYNNSEIWFVTGAQLLYGGETVRSGRSFAGDC